MSPKGCVKYLPRAKELGLECKLVYIHPVPVLEYTINAKQQIL